MEVWKEALPFLNMSVPFDLESNTVAVFRVGSHSHGTFVPSGENGIDDVDLMVIVMQPASYKLGFQPFDNASYKHGPLDVVIYDWGKWLGLLRKSNPNVVGNLWLEDEDKILTAFQPLHDLMDNRDKLLSQQLYKSFIGYAQGQMYKMKHTTFMGYMGDKRKKLVEEFGYDTKNAAHMIRLQRMCIEALEQQKLNVKRSDAAELIDIKKGGWTFEKVMHEATKLSNHAQLAMSETKLREFIDEPFLRSLTTRGYLEWWEENPEQPNVRRELLK